MSSNPVRGRAAMAGGTPAPSVLAHWRWRAFRDLSPEELYAALARRAEVFVLEQQCVFVDPDDYDPQGFHLLGFDPREPDALIAYLRVLPPGTKYAQPSIGRVLTAASHRGLGLGRELMAEGLRRTRLQFPGEAIRIGAQERLQNFYESLGFVLASAMYLEDGIPHVEMVLA